MKRKNRNNFFFLYMNITVITAYFEVQLYMVSQILTNVKEITLVTWTLPARTPTVPMFVIASLDLMEMVITVQVNLISLL